MSFIVLYRYHTNFELVKSRLRLIKHIDPNIPIYGIYGGSKEDFLESSKVLNEFLEDNYLVKVEDGRWKWLHADITYKMWYEDVGKNIDFEFASVLEWDLLYLEKIQNLFPNINKNSICLSGIIEENKVTNYWYWARNVHQKKRTEFFNKIKEYYGQSVVNYAMLGPGLCMPKEFLEGLSRIKLFEADLSDEIKIPIWAQILGFDLISNNFYRKWFSFFELKYFNANVVDVQFETVKRELDKKNGRRAFHPYREPDKLEKLIGLYDTSVSKFGHYINHHQFPVKTINPISYKIHCKMADWKYGTNN